MRLLLVPHSLGSSSRPLTPPLSAGNGNGNGLDSVDSIIKVYRQCPRC
jgi:hypothetical protein